MASRKDKRKSGWREGVWTVEGKKKDLLNQCLEPQPFYDDWVDWRDGMRWLGRDRTKITKHIKPKPARNEKWYKQGWTTVIQRTARFNQKNKIMLKRRKQRKFKSRLFQ